MTEEQQFEEIVESDQQDFPESPASDLETLARETWNKLNALGLTEQPWDVILSALNMVAQARDTDFEAACLQFNIRIAATKEEMQNLSDHVSRQDKEIKEICLAQKDRIAVLNEAVRERDELAEEFRQQRNMLKQACFNKDAALDMKDTEIARLTDENERMRDALKFIQNNLLAWNEVVRDDTISDSAVRGAACMRIATLHEIARAALDKHGEPPHRADGE